MNDQQSLAVIVNPDKTVDGQPITALNPRTGDPWPTGPFDLTPADLSDPRVLRLFPGPEAANGRPGGVFADLVPYPPPGGDRSRPTRRPASDGETGAARPPTAYRNPPCNREDRGVSRHGPARRRLQ